MTHHVKAGTVDDPDLANYANDPVTRTSLLDSHRAPFRLIGCPWRPARAADRGDAFG